MVLESTLRGPEQVLQHLGKTPLRIAIYFTSSTLTRDLLKLDAMHRRKAASTAVERKTAVAYSVFTRIAAVLESER